MPHYTYRQLEPTPTAKLAFTQWIDHLDQSFTQYQDADRRSDVVRQQLARMFTSNFLGAGTGLTGNELLDMSLDPRNITLEPEYYGDVDSLLYAQRKPLIYLWQMFDRSPLGLNHWLGFKLRAMLGRHIFRQIGHNVKIFHNVEFSFGYNLTIEDDCVIHRNVLLDDRGEIILRHGTSVSDYANIYSHTHDIHEQSDVTNKLTEIGPRARITYHATVLAGARVGEDAMLGAMGIATRDVPAHAVSLGIPAKVARMKDRGYPQDSAQDASTDATAAVVTSARAGSALRRNGNSSHVYGSGVVATSVALLEAEPMESAVTPPVPHSPTRASIHSSVAPHTFHKEAVNPKTVRVLPQIADSILELVGNTPLLHLKSLSPAGGASVYAKLEYLNPGGSIKDRAALGIVTDAERTGRLCAGGTIVEATAGNTGIGLALIGISRGYRVHLFVPMGFAEEKVTLMRALGAVVERTPDTEGMPGAIHRAREFAASHPHTFVASQFENQANPEFHYATTAVELYEQMGESIDGFAAGVGSAGTFSGIARFLKEHEPHARTLAVETQGSVLQGGAPGKHRIEGIGVSFVPDTFDRSVCDEIVRVSDDDAFAMVRRLALEEGVLAGSSAGANVFAAVELAKRLGPGKRVVTIVPDSAERYLSKHIFEPVQ